jgi:cobalt-zinc-cadmium efflux system protein
VRSAYLEVMGDAISSGGVIVAGVVILSTGWTIADPIAGALIALFLLPRTWALLRQAVNILLEGAPAHLDVTEIEEALCSAPSVRRVHDLHVWTLTSGREAMSVHVVVEPGAPSDKILEALHVILSPDSASITPPSRSRPSQPSHPDHPEGGLDGSPA